MEDYLEYIIYIILAFGALIGNVYRNYAKKKEMQQRKVRNAGPDEMPLPRQEPAFPDLETLLGIPKQQPEFEPEEIIFEAPSKEPEKTEQFTDATNEGRAMFEKTSRELITDDILPESKDPFESDLIKNDITTMDAKRSENRSGFKFDPVKAVIFSEVLKRPEF